MLDVAGLALFCARQQAVKANGLHPLPGNVQVAILAFVIGDAVDGGVAVDALLLEHGMAAEAA